MADITVTAANVAKGTVNNPQTEWGTAGVAITAGQTLYKDLTDRDVNNNPKLKLADCDLSLAASRLAGVALNGGAAGQPIQYQWNGRYTVGGTVVRGKIYVASGNGGGIAPIDDLASADYVSILGVGASTTEIDIHIFNSESII